MSDREPLMRAQIPSELVTGDVGEARKRLFAAVWYNTPNEPQNNDDNISARIDALIEAVRVEEKAEREALVAERDRLRAIAARVPKYVRERMDRLVAGEAEGGGFAQITRAHADSALSVAGELQVLIGAWSGIAPCRDDGEVGALSVEITGDDGYAIVVEVEPDGTAEAWIEGVSTVSDAGEDELLHAPATEIVAAIARARMDSRDSSPEPPSSVRERPSGGNQIQDITEVEERSCLEARLGEMEDRISTALGLVQMARSINASGVASSGVDWYIGRAESVLQTNRAALVPDGEHAKS